MIRETIVSVVFLLVGIAVGMFILTMSNPPTKEFSREEVSRTLPTSAIRVRPIGGGWCIFAVFDMKTEKESKDFLFSPQYNVLAPLE